MAVLLVIGRFQPFHLGHLHMLRKASDGGKNRLKIAVGSSGESGTPANPFSAKARRRMIERSLSESGGIGNYSVHLVPDAHDDARWLELVLRRCGSFDAVVSGNGWVGRIFKGAGFEVVGPAFLKRRTCNGTAIRRMIERGGERWKARVPSGVARTIGGP